MTHLLRSLWTLYLVYRNSKRPQVTYVAPEPAHDRTYPPINTRPSRYMVN
jgi:hypothetical protein